MAVGAEAGDDGEGGEDELRAYSAGANLSGVIKRDELMDSYLSWW